MLEGKKEKYLNTVKTYPKDLDKGEVKDSKDSFHKEKDPPPESENTTINRRRKVILGIVIPIVIIIIIIGILLPLVILKPKTNGSEELSPPTVPCENDKCNQEDRLSPIKMEELHKSHIVFNPSLGDFKNYLAKITTKINKDDDEFDDYKEIDFMYRVKGERNFSDQSFAKKEYLADFIVNEIKKPNETGDIVAIPGVNLLSNVRSNLTRVRRLRYLNRLYYKIFQEKRKISENINALPIVTFSYVENGNKEEAKYPKDLDQNDLHLYGTLADKVIPITTNELLLLNNATYKENINSKGNKEINIEEERPYYIKGVPSYGTKSKIKTTIEIKENGEVISCHSTESNILGENYIQNKTIEISLLGNVEDSEAANFLEELEKGIDWIEDQGNESVEILEKGKEGRIRNLLENDELGTPLIYERSPFSSTIDNHNLSLNSLLDAGISHSNSRAFVETFHALDEQNDKIFEEGTATTYPKIVKDLARLTEVSGEIKKDFSENIIPLLRNMKDNLEPSINNMTAAINQINANIFSSCRSIYSYTLMSSDVFNEIEKAYKSIEQDIEKISKNQIDIGKLEFKNKKDNLLQSLDAYVRGILGSLKDLISSLKSSDSRQMFITYHYHYKNLSISSYDDLIQKASKIFENHFSGEVYLIKPVIDKFINEAEQILQKKIEDSLEIFNELADRIQNQLILIEGDDGGETKAVLAQKYLRGFKKLNQRIWVNVRDSFNLALNVYEIEGEKTLEDDYVISKFKNDVQKAMEDANNIESFIKGKAYIDNVYDDIMKTIRFQYLDNINVMITDLKNWFTQKTTELPLNELRKEFSSIINNIITLVKQENKNLTYEMANINSENSYEGQFNDSTNELENIITYDQLNSIKEVFNTIFTNIYEDLENLVNKLSKDSSNYANDMKIRYENIQNSYKSDRYFIIGKTSRFQVNYDSFINIFPKIDLLTKNTVKDKIKDFYKNMLLKIREPLNKIINHKVHDFLGSFPDLKFITDSKIKIQNILSKIEKYVSDNIFNQKYQQKSKDKSTSINNIIINSQNDFKTKLNNILSNSAFYSQNTDIYYRRFAGTVVNCYKVWHHFHRKTKCVYADKTTWINEVSPYTDSYISIQKINFPIDNYFNELLKKINDINNNLENSSNKVLNKLDEIYSQINSVITVPKNDTIISNEIKDIYNYYHKLTENYLSKNIISQTYNEIIKDVDTNLIILCNEVLVSIESQLNSYYQSLKEKKNDFKSLPLEIYYLIFIYQDYYYGFGDDLFNDINSKLTIQLQYSLKIKFQRVIGLFREYQNYLRNKIEYSSFFKEYYEKRKNEIESNFELVFKELEVKQKEFLNITTIINELNLNKNDMFNISNIIKQFQDNFTIMYEPKLTDIETFILDEMSDGEENYLSQKFYLESNLFEQLSDNLYKTIYYESSYNLGSDKYFLLYNQNTDYDQNTLVEKIEQLRLKTNKLILDEWQNLNDTMQKNLDAYILTYIDLSKILNEIEINSKNLPLPQDNLVAFTKTKVLELSNNIINLLNNERNSFKEIIFNYFSDSSNIYSRFNSLKTQISNIMKQNIVDTVKPYFQNSQKKYIDNLIIKYMNQLYAVVTSQTYEEKSFINLTTSFNKIYLEYVPKKREELSNNVIEAIEEYEKNYQFKLKTILDYNELINNIYNNINNLQVSFLEEFENAAAKVKENYDTKTYDFPEELQKKILSLLSSFANEIKQKYIELYPKKYSDEIEIPSNEIEKYFSKANVLLVNESYKLFLSFYEKNKKEEKESYSKLLSEITKDNFENQIKVFKESFGAMYFEKLFNEIKTDFYQPIFRQLISITNQTYGFYSILYSDVEELQEDLKNKLININYVINTSEKQFKKLKIKLNESLVVFLESSTETIVNDYISFMKDDSLVKETLSENILNFIVTYLKSSKNDLSIIYKNISNKYEIIPFIKNVSEGIDELLGNYITFADGIIERHKILYQDIKLLKTDVNQELVDNRKKALDEAISTYEKFNSTDYLEFPGNNSLLYDNVGNVTKNKILNIYNLLNNEIDSDLSNITEQTRALAYESYNTTNFDNQLKSINNSFDKNLQRIKYICDDIETNVEGNLEQKMIEERSLRILNILFPHYIRRVEENSFESIYKGENSLEEIDEIFDSFYKEINNTDYDKFILSIKDYKKELNVHYSEGKEQLNNDIENDTILYSQINNALDEIYNKGMQYYIQLNNSFNQFKDFINSIPLKVKEEIENTKNKINNIINEKFTGITNNITFNYEGDNTKESGKVYELNETIYTEPNTDIKSKVTIDSKYNLRLFLNDNTINLEMSNEIIGKIQANSTLNTSPNKSTYKLEASFSKAHIGLNITFDLRNNSMRYKYYHKQDPYTIKRSVEKTERTRAYRDEMGVYHKSEKITKETVSYDNINTVLDEGEKELL